MRLLLSRIRLRVRPTGRGTCWLCAWLAVVPLFEWAGWQSRSEPVAAACLVLFAGLALATARGHARKRIPWVDAVLAPIRALGRRLAGSGFEVGVDFRGTPPLPRGFPRPLRFAAVFAAAVLCGALVGHRWCPVVFDRLGAASFTLEVAALGLTWAALLAAGGALALQLVMVAFDHLPSPERYLGTLPLRARLSTLAAVFVGLLGLALLGPDWFPLLGIAVVGGVCLLVESIRTGSDFALLWKAASGDEVRSFSGRALLLRQVLVQAGVAGALVLVSVGAPATGGVGAEVLPVTRFLGWLFSWLAFAATGALAATILLAHGYRLALWSRSRRPHAVRLCGGGSDRESRVAARALRANGFVVHRGSRRSSGELVCSLGPHAGAADPFDDSRRLVLAMSELTRPAILERLRRRSVTGHRRLFVRGMLRVLRRARAVASARGTGFWLGPQHWFLTGPCRDEVEEEPDGRRRMLEPGVGPLYWSELSWRARAQHAELMRDLDIDLTFVEDGVPLSAVRRVLETLFELHDIFGSRRPVTERHFVGITGVRVMLHECGMGVEAAEDEESGYPEPGYHEIARARVLHVFRDRGEDAADVTVPEDSTDRHSPLVGV